MIDSKNKIKYTYVAREEIENPATKQNLEYCQQAHQSKTCADKICPNLQEDSARNKTLDRNF